MTIIQANQTHRPAIIRLLKSENLPGDDLPADLGHFFIGIENGEMVGAIGLEHYGPYGLLRSMVVHKDHRNKQIAATLVNTLEKYAASLHITEVYLLTETALEYFSKKNYRQVARADVPAAIQQSSEFASVCPVSAAVMLKVLKK